MKAMLLLLREAVEALRRISGVLAGHGVGHADDCLPRFVILTDRPRLVDMRGAASLAGYKSPDMVQRLIDRDDFPLPVIGGNGGDYRWRVSDIEAWVASLCQVERMRGAGHRRESSSVSEVPQ